MYPPTPKMHVAAVVMLDWVQHASDIGYENELTNCQCLQHAMIYVSSGELVSDLIEAAANELWIEDGHDDVLACYDGIYS